MHEKSTFVMRMISIRIKVEKPIEILKGLFVENVSKTSIRKSITEWHRPLENQIVISAIVTVRDSSGHAGFPQIPNFELGNMEDRHNRLYIFMYEEFVNQKNLTNMLLRGTTNHLIYKQEH